MSQADDDRLRVIGKATLMVAEAHCMIIALGESGEQWAKLVEMASMMPPRLVEQLKLLVKP